MSITTTVADLMTVDPIVVKPESPLQEAIRLIAENRISGLPVVNQEGKLVGVISETDLMWQEAGARPPAYIMLLDSVIYLENPANYDRELHKALGQTVGEVMSKEFMTVKAEQPLRDAAQLMHEQKIQRLLVVDANKHLAGILTRGDIVRFMASRQ